MHIFIQQAGLLMNSRRKMWRTGLNLILLLKQEESSSSLTLIWKEDIQYTKKRKKLKLRFCRSLDLAVYDFSRISVIWRGIFFCLYFVFIFLGNCIIVLSLALVATLSMVQFKNFIIIIIYTIILLFWEQVIFLFYGLESWGGYHCYL